MERRDQLRKTLLTPAEASALFNVSLRTIYFWYRTGNIKGINVNGKCLRIFSKSISEFLRSKTGVGSKEGSVGRRRNSKADGVPALPTEQGRQMVRRYDGDGQCEMSSVSPGPDSGPLTELTPAEREMLRSLVECAGVPGYHDWAGMGFRKSPEPMIARGPGEICFRPGDLAAEGRSPHHHGERGFRQAKRPPGFRLTSCRTRRIASAAKPSRGKWQRSSARFSGCTFSSWAMTSTSPPTLMKCASGPNSSREQRH